jgi:hypothetical protein
MDPIFFEPAFLDAPEIENTKLKQQLAIMDEENKRLRVENECIRFKHECLASLYKNQKQELHELREYNNRLRFNVQVPETIPEETTDSIAGLRMRLRRLKERLQESLEESLQESNAEFQPAMQLPQPVTQPVARHIISETSDLMNCQFMEIDDGTTIYLPHTGYSA